MNSETGPTGPESEVRPWRSRTRLIHGDGHAAEPPGAVAAGIPLSTTFLRDERGELRSPFVYARTNNPARADLERRLAEISAGTEAAAFASGLAAANAVLQSLDAASRVLLGRDLYFGVRQLFRVAGTRAGHRIEEVDWSDSAAAKTALAKPAALVWAESPSNPELKIVDLAQLATLARGAGAIFVVDNTLATPLGQAPLALGADLVLEACTKAIGGHSDVTVGALIVRDQTLPLWARVRELQNLAGAVPSPFDCWLVIRGLSTLAVRQREAVESALDLATQLARNPAVERVLYPGLPSHPGHAIAARQMTHFGSLLSILVRGGESAAARVIARVRLWSRATSFGGVHSLIEHRYLVEGVGSRTPPNLLRLSVGLEDPRDLREDLEAALRSD